MAEHDPDPQRRLLAAPAESRTRTLVVAFLVSAVCALAVSMATVYLRPIQKANRAAEERARLEALVQGVPGMAELLRSADGVLTAVVVDLDRGYAAKDVTTTTLDAALADPANWTALAPGDDPAGLGTRPDFAQVYLLRDDTGIALILLPVRGQGYNGTIDAILAIRGDLTTIAGLAVTRHSETPGLGARIEEAAWQAGFPGVEAFDHDGQLRFKVARGEAASAHEVDGITGATRTSNAITQMVRFWLGPLGYGPFLDAIRRGEF
jgi:Na+-transporting NADH:ubiquinone oxidoreductase subunit C